ncbi:hypothetical protein FRC09_003001 [Ceratobasidium sp. 395]|nr:hypothetical protein FRC09_003001 [Ceratobasidium sp. 395]
MGTRGVKAYLYKKRYYRTYIPCSAHPDTFGAWFAEQVPRDERDRQAWITSLIEQIELEVCWRNECGIPDKKRLDLDYEWGEVEHGFEIFYEGRPMVFQDIKSIEDGMVPDKDYATEWSYVIDLDNRAFTINGLMHFRLDNMPSGSINRYFWRIPSSIDPGTNCIPTFAHPPSTPVEYIATVSRWPHPDFDVIQTHEEYKAVAPILVSTEEWGAPTWTSLTTAQQLSENLVQVILRDSAERLSNPDVTKTRLSFCICLWQVLSAAAPSHLCCLPDSDSPTSQAISNDRVRPIYDLDNSGLSNCMTPHYFTWESMHDKNYDHKPHWFRGCLVVFCPRLDDSEYVEYETLLMVSNLRKFGRTTGVGIIFSGRHVLAVSVDGDTVRCSHPLPFHDVKMKIQDGFLLATHLLSLHTATNKTPWIHTPSSVCPAMNRPRRLPDELILEIAFYLGDSDYRRLGQVSRLFRGVYANYPRVLDYVLLGYAGNGNYSVLHNGTMAIQTLHLQRCAPFNHHYENLAHSFKHISHGAFNLRPGRSYDRSCIVQGAEAEHEATLEKNVKFKRNNCLSQIHLQAVFGMWDFVPPAEARSNFPGEAKFDPVGDFREGKGTWSEYRW